MIIKKLTSLLKQKFLRHKSNQIINIKMKNRKMLIYFLGVVFIHFFIFRNFTINFFQRDIEGWPRTVSRNLTHYIKPDINTTLIHSNICDNYGSENPLFLLIVVSSSVNNFEARQAIRKTWGNTSQFNYELFDKLHGSQNAKYLNINHNDWQIYADSKNTGGTFVKDANFRIKVAFLLGLPSNEKSDIQQSIISYEHDRYGDIIQEDFIDRYNNLTLKTVFMLKWIQNNCLDKAKYIMKIDDDMFLNIPNLIHILLGGTIPIYNSTIHFYDDETIFVTNKKNRIPQTDHLILGHKYCDEKKNTNPLSKWFAPEYMYSDPKYPEFLSGAAYVITMETLKLLYMQSLSVPLFYLEDVYLTGIVAEQTKVKRTHNPLFLILFPDWIDGDDKCIGRGIVARHGIKPSKLYDLYDFVTNLAAICPFPEENVFLTNLNLENRKGCY